MNIEDTSLHLIKNRIWSKLTSEDIVKYRDEIIAELKHTQRVTKYMMKIISELTMQEVYDIWSDKSFEVKYLFASKDGKEDLQIPIDFIKSNGLTIPSTYNLIDVRYYREEEMLAHPELFTMDSFSTVPILYFSRDTLKFLNKFHGRKFRYHKKMESFIQIIANRSINKMPMTYDDIIYLLKKLNPDNKSIIDALTSSRTRVYLGNNAPELNNLLKAVR